MLFLYNYCKELTPNFRLRWSKYPLGNGLVKISTICSFVSTYSCFKTFLDTCSLRKWYYIGMCFFLECMKEFFDIFMALVLSQFISIGCSYFINKYSSVYFIQITWIQHDTTRIYSASIMERKMEDCFLLDQDTKQFPKKNVVPLVLFRSTTLLTQSASVNVFKLKYWLFGYHNPYFKPPFKYLKILFMLLNVSPLVLTVT